MSDDEGKGSGGGYRIELAKSKQAACKGPKPCKGTKIQKGELRMGVVVDFRGHSTFQWRHWGCVTPAVLSNMKKKHPEVEDLDGFEDLDDGFQAKIETAWQEGHVADEDIPDSARKGPDDTNEDEDDDKKKKTASKRKAAPRKKKARA
ncbi:hypothetical protein BS47DRAFT_1303166 [Hydnum rufescens UP504]|uniref:PARP-type domain-containing protein n=1 Tax=Hydnum rufescens UP504 TaxID=1448309 RepID=A0A9P6ALL7_9AGAM|nr:hypothetical protein BS47DRAFT_1303166 [Hydnum rufescens UP504]